MRTLPCELFEPTSSPGTPTASVSPDSETERPKLSAEAPSDAVTVPCANQLLNERVYMRTLPWMEFVPTESVRTPTATVSPESDTDPPK